MFSYFLFMILILSEESDHSTNKVIEWLLFYELEFIRINMNDSITISSLEEDIYIEINKDTKINLNKIKSYWYRRGAFIFACKLDNKHEKLKNYFFKTIDQNSIILGAYLDFLLKKKKHINNFNTSEVNKLIVLNYAKSVGLKIPKTHLINNYQQLGILLENNRLITKNLCNPPVVEMSKFNYLMYTTEINEKDVSDIPPDREIFPSLIQERINKQVEIRTFFLEGNFYSMAIFSQSNEQTKLDFRRYDYNRPSRQVRFELPIEIKQKTLELMRLLELNSGSIDFIVDTNEDIIFLEVNPIGQFGMISTPCNYFLEREIAKYLDYD